MRGALPGDIPKSGERYNITLEAIGINSERRPVARFIVDNGEYRGKRISTCITREELAELGPVVEKQSRYSALLTVKRLYKVGRKWIKADKTPEGCTQEVITYTLSEFGQAEGESEVKEIFNRNNSKFIRK